MKESCSAITSHAHLHVPRSERAARLLRDGLAARRRHALADQGEDDLVAFDDFADWYTDGGYKVASWLELLDLSKWVL